MDGRPTRNGINTNVWLAGLLGRRHPSVAAVALANKNVPTDWALLAHGRKFRPIRLATSRRIELLGTGQRQSGDRTTDCQAIGQSRQDRLDRGW